MSNVKLVNVNKIYDNNVQAVFDFNLEINDGEFVVFVGPSGCGKSTTLRMIAGLEEITDGQLLIDGEVYNDILPKNRDIAMVFQNYALYPHMTVYENMAFGLKNRHVSKEEIKQRVLEAAEILGISEYLNRKPKALSGGQCQRVALGRAIVRHAKVFLMDEPLSNLDAKLRVQMRSEIIKLHKRIGSIVIYVTHDQTEAMTMADKIVVMNKGHIQQIGTPREIYNHPKNMFVASFIGSPSMNFIDCDYDHGVITYATGEKVQLKEETIKACKEFYENQLAAANSQLANIISKVDEQNNKYHNKSDYIPIVADDLEIVKQLKEKIAHFDTCLNKEKFTIVLGVRPEDIKVHRSRNDKAMRLKASVVELLGKNQIVHFNIGDNEIQADVSSKHMLEMDHHIYVTIDLDMAHLFDKVTSLAIL